MVVSLNNWPPAGSGMGALIRLRDWFATALGPIDAWPLGLRMAVSAALDSPWATVVLWGSELTQIYNDAFRPILGLRHPPGTGQPTCECWPEAWHFNGPIMRRVLATGQAEQLEDQEYVIALSGTDETRYFTVSFAALRDECGVVRGVQSVALETTRRVRAERDKQALVAAERVKGELLEMLACKLRGQLAPIVMAADIVGRADADPQRIAGLSEVIVRQTGCMTHLLDDLLDMLYLTEGKLTLDREAVDVGEVVGVAVGQVQALMLERGHDLRLHMPESGMHVLGDRLRLVQIVTGILDNAARYTPHGGTIELQVVRAGPNLMLSVRDNGRGIGQDLLGQVFDMAGRAGRAGAPPEGGCGLGLALARGLLALQDGRISARSAGEGQGSEFTLWLPLLAPARQVLPQPARASAPALSVMVVDDNADIARMMAAALESDGCKVLLADTAQGALERAHAASPQVFLIDIGLPGMDGYELARQLRARPESAQALLIACTGYSQPDDFARAREAGFNEHFVKPVNLDKLAALLAQHRVHLGARRRAVPAAARTDATHL